MGQNNLWIKVYDLPLRKNQKLCSFLLGDIVLD